MYIKMILKVVMCAVSVILLCGFAYMIYSVVSLDHQLRPKPTSYWTTLITSLIFILVFLFLSLNALHGTFKENLNSLSTFYSSMVCIMFLAIIQFGVSFYAYASCDDPMNFLTAQGYVNCAGNPWGAPDGTLTLWIVIMIFAIGAGLVAYYLFVEIRRERRKERDASKRRSKRRSRHSRRSSYMA